MSSTGAVVASPHVDSTGEKSEEYEVCTCPAVGSELKQVVIVYQVCFEPCGKQRLTFTTNVILSFRVDWCSGADRQSDTAKQSSWIFNLK